MSSQRLAITTVDKLVLLPLAIFALFRLGLAAILAPLDGRKTVTSAVTIFVRTFFDTVTPAQLQWMFPSMRHSYRSLASGEAKNSPQIDLPDGGRAYWIGSKDATNVIVYFHGGGYACPASREHIKWLMAARRILNTSSHDVSVLLLSYSLAPQAKYPTQLKQAISLLSLLFDKEGLSPSGVMLGGDSAGGNLVLGAISHIMHPHPEIAPLKLKAPLLGTFLISPWTTFDYTVPAWKTSNWDMLTPSCIDRATHSFLGERSADNYTEASRAPASWWKDLAKTTKHMYVWYGKDEGLRDDIIALSETFKKVTDVTVVGEAKVAHVGIIIDHFLPSKDRQTSLTLWMNKILQTA